MITSSVNRVIYKGNGVATEFAYPFKIFDRTDIKVLLVDKDGNRSILTSDYYVDMEAMKVYYPGYAPGAVEPGTEQPAILQEGETLVVYRDVPITQMDRMPENYPFDVNERMHDKSCVIDQQLADAVNRALSASVDAPEGFVGDVPIVAGKSFRISSDGMRLETTEDPARVLPLAQALLEQTAAAAENAGISADITQEDVRIVIEIRNTFPQTVATANAALNQTKEGYKGELQEAYEAHSNALNQEYAGYTAGLTDKQVEAVGAISEAKRDATGTIAADKTAAATSASNALAEADRAKREADRAEEEVSKVDMSNYYSKSEVDSKVGGVANDVVALSGRVNHINEVDYSAGIDIVLTNTQSYVVPTNGYIWAYFIASGNPTLRVNGNVVLTRGISTQGTFALTSLVPVKKDDIVTISGEMGGYSKRFYPMKVGA